MVPGGDDLPAPASAAEALAPPIAPPSKKPRREVNWATKHEILKFNRTHSDDETLARFPEIKLMLIADMRDDRRELLYTSFVPVACLGLRNPVHTDATIWPRHFF